MQEIYKPIEEAPNYAISNFGNIKSYCIYPEGKIIHPSYDKDGYLKITLAVEKNKSITRRVNRLVAQAFIPNPDNLPMVNHLDCVRDNNNVNNLEWCDNSRNQSYSFEMGRLWDREVHEKYMTPIKTINTETGEELEFDSINACARYYNTSSSAINNRLSNMVRNPSNNPKSNINNILFQRILIKNSNDYPIG